MSDFIEVHGDFPFFVNKKYVTKIAVVSQHKDDETGELIKLNDRLFYVIFTLTDGSTCDAYPVDVEIRGEESEKLCYEWVREALNLEDK